MEHILHIQKQKKNLEARFFIIKCIREFFWSKNFLEVETPNILRYPGQEPYLSPISLNIHNEKGNWYKGYLHTSPEYTMKKMLAVGFENIFSLGKCYRNYESFGKDHNPEFTMLEWYRSKNDMWKLMDDTEELINFIIKKCKENKIFLKGVNNEYFSKWKKVHMNDLWRKYINVDLCDFLDLKSMKKLCVEKGFSAENIKEYENAFYLLFLNLIEPHLGKNSPTIVHHYPVQMAALAKISKEDKRFAERFEVYIKGKELANAFSELTDEKEQEKRLLKEKNLRKKLGKSVFSIDKDFISAVKNMPESAGIALGVDRLVQALTGCKDINDVLVLPMSTLFKD